MEWVWELYREYVVKRLAAAGDDHPDESRVQQEFMRTLGGSRVTILVQEPWQNSVRFKTLARHDWEEMTDLIRDPLHYLQEHYGGGKYKLNFHEGWNFIATRNFKPDGEPRWKEMDELDPEPPLQPLPGPDQP